MASPKKMIRGMQDIKTHSSKVNKTLQPYEIYLRISCLEMEKARRSKERESAMDRVKKIDLRCQEIDDEKKQLLAVLREKHNHEALENPSLSCSDNSSGSPYPEQGFMIKYGK